MYHSKPNVKKSKSHEDKLGNNDKLKQVRRYSSAEVGKSHDYGVGFSNSIQDNLSKINEQADDEDQEKSALESDAVNENTQDTDENKNRTVKRVLSASSSIDSDDGPPSYKPSLSDDDAGVVDHNSPKKKSSFEKTKSKLHNRFKRLSITDSLFSNTHTGRRMSLPAFTSLPDFKLKSPSVKSPPSSKSPEEKSFSGPTYVNMVEEKPELFVPLDGK